VAANIAAVLFLVAMNGFFVAAEFSIVKIRPGRIDALSRQGCREAVYARAITEHLDAYLSACQLGITLASLGLGWIGEPAVARMIAPLLAPFGLTGRLVGSLSFILAFSFITALHIILGELMPKTLSIKLAEKVALATAVPLTWFHRVMYPFIWLLNTLSNYLLFLLGFDQSADTESAHSDEELRQLFAQSHKSGFIDQTEMTLMDNVIDFSDRTAKEIMIPRTEMICLYTANSFEENLDVALREEMTRYPVCQPDKDNIIGFLHIKDLLFLLARRQKKDLTGIIRPLVSVPETTPISRVLRQMQKNRCQIALLIDEYGGTAGLVTLEDIVEEVFGPIQDEFDEEREAVEKIPEGYSTDGLVLVEDINALLSAQLDTEAADTIGGWLHCQLGVDPEPGQSAECSGYRFSVGETSNLRIMRVTIKKLPADAPPAG
jgi:CBS domain containing-hemolysin-like protein